MSKLYKLLKASCSVVLENIPVAGKVFEVLHRMEEEEEFEGLKQIVSTHAECLENVLRSIDNDEKRLDGIPRPGKKTLKPTAPQIAGTSGNDRYEIDAEGVIHDMETGLKWIVGPDKDMNHYQAEKWVQELTVAEGGWDMPTREELQGLYQKGKGKYNLDPVFGEFSLDNDWLWVWSNELLDAHGKYSKVNNSPRARGFDFHVCDRFSWNVRNHSTGMRVFGVRSNAPNSPDLPISFLPM